MNERMLGSNLKILGGLALLIGGIVSLRIITTVETPAIAEKATATPQIPIGHGYIERINLEGQDVAKLLDLNAWKFRYVSPRGAQGMTFWIEEWSKYSKQPAVYGLGSVEWRTLHTSEEGSILLKLPQKNNRDFVISADSTTLIGQSPISFHNPPHTMRISEALESRTSIPLAEDFALYFMSWNKGDSIASPAEHNWESIKNVNDHTILFKMAFIKKSGVKPIWKDNRIILQTQAGRN